MITDDEINLRISAIENNWQGEYPYAGTIQESVDFNPAYATDWAWCGPLVEKYEIRLEPHNADGMDAPEWWAWPRRPLNRNPWAVQETPQRAICLAVIVLHEAGV